MQIWPLCVKTAKLRTKTTADCSAQVWSIGTAKRRPEPLDSERLFKEWHYQLHTQLNKSISKADPSNLKLDVMLTFCLSTISLPVPGLPPAP